MAKVGRKKGKIEKLPLHEAKVSSAFRIDETERELIMERVNDIYGDKVGWTSLIAQALRNHLGITELDVINRRNENARKAGK
jgi:uncharacterized membrane protein YebE (DUF533 family)